MYDCVRVYVCVCVSSPPLSPPSLPPPPTPPSFDGRETLIKIIIIGLALHPTNSPPPVLQFSRSSPRMFGIGSLGSILFSSHESVFQSSARSLSLSISPPPPPPPPLHLFTFLCHSSVPF